MLAIAYEFSVVLTMLNIVFSVNYYLELHNARTIYCVAHFVPNKRSNWLFGHHRILTSLLGQKLH